MSSSSATNCPSMRARVNPRAAQRRQLPLELALAAAHDRRQHVDALVGRIEHHHVHDPLERLRRDLAIAVRTVRHADVGEEQPQVVVDFGDRADRRPRIRRRRLLLDGDRRRQAVDQIDVRLLHLLEKLAGVGRERLDVAPLAFRVDRVERQRRLARAGQTGDDDQPVARQIDVDVPKVVDARAADGDPVMSHRAWTPTVLVADSSNSPFVPAWRGQARRTAKTTRRRRRPSGACGAAVDGNRSSHTAQSDREPDAESHPRLVRQALHHEEAQRRAERSPTTWTKGTRNGRFRSGSMMAQHDHADADEHECEERPDVRQIVGLTPRRR